MAITYDILAHVETITDRNVLRELNRAVIDRMRALDRIAVGTFRVGDKVNFYGRGELVVGTVRSINQKSVTVAPDGAGPFARTWRVSPGLLRKDATNDKVTL